MKTTTFTDVGLLSCFEGAPRAAESALALFKAAPAGALFVGQIGTANASCVSQGFTSHAGAATCDAAVERYYKDGTPSTAFAASQSAALETYRVKYNLTSAVASLLQRCTCKPGAAALPSDAQCANGLMNVTGAWVHRNPWMPLDHPGMMCDEGPFVFATRTLATLKGAFLSSLGEAERVGA